MKYQASLLLNKDILLVTLQLTVKFEALTPSCTGGQLKSSLVDGNHWRPNHKVASRTVDGLSWSISVFNTDWLVLLVLKGLSSCSRVLSNLTLTSPVSPSSCHRNEYTSRTRDPTVAHNISRNKFMFLSVILKTDSSGPNWWLITFYNPASFL